MGRKNSDHTTDGWFDGEDESGSSSEFLDGSLPMVDALDVDIVMHREAHFNSSFERMLEYYRGGGKGINPEFELARIEELAEAERTSGQNMAELLLVDEDVGRIARSQEAYLKLKKAQTESKKKKTHAKLLADLILSEDEELSREIAAVVAEGADIVVSLLHLIQSKDFYDPLFPGYGLAPILAAHCLGQIGDSRAIVALFEAIGHGDFFNEDTVCQALREIGEPAKAFLLKVVASRPLNDDNERAALALGYFSDDPSAARACLAQLQDEAIWRHELLATYLILACSGLKEKEEREVFKKMLSHPHSSSSLQRDIETVISTWN